MNAISELSPIIQSILNSDVDGVVAALAAGEDVNAVTTSNWTPLHVACKSFARRAGARLGNTEAAERIIQVLLAGGADPKARDSAGNLPSKYCEDYIRVGTNGVPRAGSRRGRMNAIIADMATTHKNAARAAPAKKPAGKKVGAWIDTATEVKTDADGRTRRLLKDEERATPPGSTFRFEVSGGQGQVIMAAVVPTATSRDGLFSLPPNLKRQVQDATGGVRWTSALMALADYAVDVLEQTPGAVTIHPDSNASGEGKVCSRLEVEPGKKLTITLAAPLPAWNKETRRRISVPQDIRARINGLIDKGSFTGVALGLAQFALEHLRKNKKRLLVLQAGQE